MNKQVSAHFFNKNFHSQLRAQQLTPHDISRRTGLSLRTSKRVLNGTTDEGYPYTPSFRTTVLIERMLRLFD